MPKLTATYQNLGELASHPALNGYHIKETAEPRRPVAIVPDSIGGRNPKQKHYATLLAAAPEMRDVLEKIVRSVEAGDWPIGLIRTAKRLLKRTEKEGQ